MPKEETAELFFTVWTASAFREDAIPEESLENPLENMFHTLVTDTIVQMDLPPERMSLSEKVSVVHRLNGQCILRIKGAVTEIALQLKISEPTVYRYLNRTCD